MASEPWAHLTCSGSEAWQRGQVRALTTLVGTCTGHAGLRGEGRGVLSTANCGW